MQNSTFYLEGKLPADTAHFFTSLLQMNETGCVNPDPLVLFQLNSESEPVTTSSSG